MIFQKGVSMALLGISFCTFNKKLKNPPSATRKHHYLSDLKGKG
jgi:hypothetical protein